MQLASCVKPWHYRRHALRAAFGVLCRRTEVINRETDIPGMKRHQRITLAQSAAGNAIELLLDASWRSGSIIRMALAALLIGYHIAQYLVIIMVFVENDL